MKAEIFWIREASARLAVLPRPRGGDWLAGEIRSLVGEGVDVLVSLLTPAEVAELSLSRERAICAELGVQYISFPISDRGLPVCREEVRALIAQLRDSLMGGMGVGIHCRAGIGRSAMVAAITLASIGVSVGDAFRMIAAARGCEVPDTAEQRRWAEDYAIDV